MTRRRTRLLLPAALLMVVILLAAPGAHVSRAADNTIPVVVIGGSAAAGWHDATGQGYVVRALSAYARLVGARLSIDNQAVPGAEVVDPGIASGWPSWMAATPGGMAVIAWGFLNDLRVGTPPAAILAEIRWEIAVALKSRHVVLVVSPPATTPSFTFDRVRQQALWAAVSRMATSLDNPDVHVFDVLDAMKRVIVARHDSPSQFMAGPWDPNTAGHELAGSLLLTDMDQAFDGQMPVYVPAPVDLAPAAGRWARGPLLSD
jgi:acyl-CoA thioesterase-1